MRDKYKRQPIVPTDWPPRVGQDFFGRLALLESQDRHADPETIQQTAWCMLRGNIDEIPHFPNDKIILIDYVSVYVNLSILYVFYLCIVYTCTCMCNVPKYVYIVQTNVSYSLQLDR